MRRPGSHIRNPQRERVSTPVLSWLNFTPNHLSPSLWLDASDTATITESSGSVSQWNDKSGNGYHVTQSSGTAQPKTGTATINNRNVLAFNGSNQMERASTPALSSPYTTFAVFSLANTTNAVQYVLDSDSGVQSILSTVSNTNLRAGAGTYPNLATGISANVTYIADWVVDGTSSIGAVNGVSTAIVNMGTNTRTGIKIGASFNSTFRMTGNIAEIIAYSGALTHIDRLLVRRYLAIKWGITI